MRQRLIACLFIVVMTMGATPAQQSDTNADLRTLVEAERSFARAAGEQGMKDAFIVFAADDGIIFRRVPVNAKETWRATNPAPTGLLSWRPIYADVSRAGDLGYAYGTYESRAKSTDAKPSEQGNYMRVWKRQPGGKWRVVLEVTNPVPPLQLTP